MLVVLVSLFRLSQEAERPAIVRIVAGLEDLLQLGRATVHALSAFRAPDHEREGAAITEYGRALHFDPWVALAYFDPVGFPVEHLPLGPFRDQAIEQLVLCFPAFRSRLLQRVASIARGHDHDIEAQLIGRI